MSAFACTPAPGAFGRCRSQHGLSIVELLVGMAVGLTVTAAAALMVASQLADNRRLLLETQVQQDLRAAADQIGRDLRRAGYWHDAHLGTRTGAAGAPMRANPYAAVDPGGDGDAAQAVSYTYARPSTAEDNLVSDAERRGFRLNRGVIENQLGAGNWQALTDPATLRVTRFEVSARTQQVVLACHRACSAGATPCPPWLAVRLLTIDLSGQAVHDPKVQRSVRTRVKLRNDSVAGECRD